MIRFLSPNDVDEFIKLRMNSLKLFPEAFGASYEEGMDRETTKYKMSEEHTNNFILGYFGQETLVGMVGFERETRTKMRHKGHIWGMFVDPAHSRKGIGKQLITTCINQAQQQNGLEIIQLSVTDQAVAARKLYEYMGFQTWGIEKNSMKVGDKYLDLIHMNKIL